MFVYGGFLCYELDYLERSNNYYQTDKKLCMTLVSDECDAKGGEGK